MSNNNILMEKIDNVFNLLDNEQVLQTDVILYLCDLVQKNDSISLSETSKQKLLTVIKKNLQTSNTELQRDTLTLLCHCFDVNLFDKELLVSELLIIVIDGVFKKKLENLEDQELWLKVLDTILKFTNELTPFVLEHSVEILEAIKLALASKVNSSPKKLPVLKLLSNMISKIELNDKNTKELLTILFTVLIPSLFNETTKHFTITLDVAYKIMSKIPFPTRKADPNWTIFTRNQFATIYEPFMVKMILEEKLMYCQLWRFCLKIIDGEILTNPSLINTLLGVLEKAFKAKNMTLRKEAFMFWQFFIRCFLTSTTNKIPSQKINLLKIPLTSNISKTSELFYIKYETWCILLNTIHELSIYPNEFRIILGGFLSFSFGPTTLSKKMPNLYLKMCENFFKMIATKDLVQTYTPVKKFDISCENGMVTPDLFVQLRKEIINSVEEASVLLNNCLEYENEAQILNKLLWEALFVQCENAVKINEASSVAIIQEIHELVLRITDVSEPSKQKLNSFCNKMVLNLVVSGKYSFCLCVIDKDKTLFEFIFSKLFRDTKSFYSLSNSANILEIILSYKEKQPDYVTSVAVFSDQIKTLAKEHPTDQALIKNLFKSWTILSNEIVKIIIKDKNNIQITVMTTFTHLMNWALDYINVVNPKENILETWKNNLENFVSNIDESNSSINSICGIFSKKICEKERFDLDCSKILFVIISQLNFKKGIDGESKKELGNILQNLKNVAARVDLPNEVIPNFKKCIEFIFSNCSSKMVIAKILPNLTEIVKSLLTNHPELNLTDTLEEFTKNYKPNDKTKPLVQDLVKMVFKNKTDMFKDYFEDNANQNLLNEPDKSQEEEKLVMDGIDLNTMTPVKLKGSFLNNIESPKREQSSEKKQETPGKKKEASDDEFIYVNTPYTFNPKKLTKSQKEKLSRRREDIPAMYNDLSQSQTMEFSETSNFEDSQNNSDNKSDSTISLTSSEDENVGKKRAFSEVNNSNIENTEPELTNDEVSSSKRRRELQKLAMSNVMGFEEHLKMSATTPTRYTRYRILSTKRPWNNSQSPSKNPQTPEVSPNNPKSTLTPTIVKRGRPKGSVSKDKKARKAKTETVSSTDVIEGSENANNLSLSQSHSTPDLLVDTTKENVSVSLKNKKQALLEDLGVQKIKISTEENINIPIKLNPADKNSDETITTEISKVNKVVRVLLEKPRIIQRRNSLESASMQNSFDDEDILLNNSASNNRKRRHSLKDDEDTEEEFNRRKVPKIKLLRSPHEEKSFVIENKLETVPEKMEMESSFNENEKETESISSEIFNEIPLNTIEYPNANNSICRKVLFEKNSDSEEMNLDLTSEKPSSPQKEPVIEIVTSPIRHDTPTRNKELLDNTLEISPIKNSSSRNITLDFEQKDEGEKSPELFTENTTKEVVISECLTPMLPKRKNKFGSKSRELSRGAQMMHLINPNGSCVLNENNTPNKDPDVSNLKTEPRVATPIVSNSRISKMMIQFDNKNMDKIEENETPTKNQQPENEGDFLKFTKKIPLPSASPRFGILRKDGISPGTRQKRVNFNDPPFTSLKFVEKYHNQHQSNKITKIDKQDIQTELLLASPDEKHVHTVISTNIEINGITESTEYCEIYQKACKEDAIQSLLTEANQKPERNEENENYIIESESPLSPEQKTELIDISSSDETNIDVLTPADVSKLYAKHTECPELLSSCLNHTPQNEKLISVLKNVNIKTMGEFAKFVIEDPKVLTVFEQCKQILDNHNCEEHLTKPIRKIKPTTIGSPRKIPSSLGNTEEILSGVSETSPSTLERNISESQERILNTFETQSTEAQNEVLNQICLTQGGSSNTLDWNKLFCNIIGADQFVKLLLLQESSRNTNFVSIVKFILNYNPQKFIETILEMVSTSKTLKNEFQNKFLPEILKITNLNCLKNNLTLGELQGLFLARLKTDSERTELSSFNSTELFDTILRFSPKNIQSFIPKILENPSYNSCIIKNLSLFEMQEHLIERLTKDSGNKDAFLNRLNQRLGNKLKIIKSDSCSNEVISDSLESSTKNVCTLQSSLDLMKSLYLGNISSEDWLILKSISDTINNLFYTHLTFKK